MSVVKLLKKHELNMHPELKNGKHHTFNIYSLLLSVLFILFQSYFAYASYAEANGKWVIVIDPGHGGNDPGALGSFSREKDINLAIALKTGEYLKNNIENVTIIYTRKNDSKVDLIERPRIANRNKADLFISIHTNWAKQKNVYGAETYIMGLAKDQENLEVAMKENEVILLEDDYSTKYQGFDPKSPESYIMFTLMQNLYQKQSIELAAMIQSQFRERADRKDRGVKQAGFWVLYNTSMPSILIETGFITNMTEEKFLNSKQGQDYIASAIFRACRDYMKGIDEKSGISAIQIKEEKPLPPVQTSVTEIVFMVQIATATKRTENNPENFKGLTDITEITDNERFRYAAGSFADYSQAVEYRKKLESVFPDAFVIAVKDNKILPLQQVLEQTTK